MRLVPVAVDRDLGAGAWPEALRAVCGKEDCQVHRPAVRDAAQVILDRLALAARRPDLEFRAKVLDSRLMNAFALPGGTVVVTTSLMDLMDGPEELAAVLAHEMSHVLARHQTEQLIHMAGMQMLVWSWLGQGAVMGRRLVEEYDGSGVFRHLRVARDNEAEADASGVRLLTDAWIDPKGMPSFMRKLASIENKAQVGQGPVFLRTHPAGSARTEAIDKLLADAPARAWLPVLVDWRACRAELAELAKQRRARALPGLGPPFQ